jgi:hypothetical protein
MPDMAGDRRMQMQLHAVCMLIPRSADDCVSVMSIHYVRQPNRKPVPDVH